MFVAGVGLTALATRLYLLGDKSIWLDEAWSWHAATTSFSDMIERTKNDVHPPLYYVLLHWWLDVFGDSETSLRLPSALFGTASIVLVSAAAWRIGGLLLGCLTAVLLVANPADLQFTQEARMYPLIGLLSLVATLLLAEFIIRPRAAWLAMYIAAGIALAYTHYSGFVVLGLHGVLLMCFGVRQWRREDDFTILTGATLAGLAVLLAYIPWWSTFFSQSGTGVGHLPDPTISLARATVRAALGLDAIGAFSTLLAAPLGAGIAYAMYRRRDDPRVVCLATLALVPAALFAASLFVKPAFDIKRSAPFIPAMAFLSALAIVETIQLARRALAAERRRIALAAIALFVVALVGAMSIGMRDWYDRGAYEDWRQISRDVTREAVPVYYYAGYLNDPLNYYVGDRERLYPLTTNRAAIGSTLILASGQTPSDHGYLIISHSNEQATAEIVAALGGAYQVGEAVQYSGGGVEVYPLVRR